MARFPFQGGWTRGVAEGDNAWRFCPFGESGAALTCAQLKAKGAPSEADVASMGRALPSGAMCTASVLWPLLEGMPSAVGDILS